MVQATLDDLARNRTTIIIAHRLSTVRNADCIYVLYHGRLLESGNHEELIRKKASTTSCMKPRRKRKPVKQRNEDDRGSYSAAFGGAVGIGAGTGAVLSGIPEG